VRCVIDEPSDHAGRKLTRYHVVDAMNRRLRDGQLTVKRPHRLSRNRRKDASDLDIYLERVTGIEPALSAWEVSSAICGLRAETLICGILARLATSDRESPLLLTRSGT